MTQELLQSIKRGCSNTKKGFSLVEAMLAISVFGLLVTVLSGVLIYGQRSSRSGSDRQKATFLAEEGLEAVRNIRDEDFSNLVDGQYGLAVSSGRWVLSGTSDEVRNYTRVINISTVDENRKKVTAQVAWEEDSGVTRRAELSTYLSNWQKEVVAGSCALACQSLAHLDGTCRADTSECITNSEINETTGDAFCTVNPNNTCCCSVPPDPSDVTAPAAISNLALSNPSPSSIQLSWTAPGDDASTGTATAYDIRYSTSAINELNWSDATHFSTAQVPAIAGSAESIVVDGIMASTEYFFAIKTADEVSNLSAISNVPSSTTLAPLDSTAPATISDLSSIDVTPNSVEIGWTAPGDNGSTGTATTYDIRYSTSAINDSNWDSATEYTGEPAPSVAGTSESAIISGLNPVTQYYFAIKTSDEVPNQSAISNVIDVLTSPLPDTTAPSAVSNLTLSDATQTTISLSWTAPGDDANTGTASSYDIRYSTSVIDESNWSSASQLIGEPLPTSVGTAESATVNGLVADVTYYFAMKTSDEVPNVSTLSNVPSLSTLPAPDVTAPSAISNLALSLATASTTTLTWSAPGDDETSGTATSYDIRYSTSLITEANWSSAPQLSGEPTPALAGTTQTFAARGLTSNTNYYFAVKTADEAGNISSISNVPNLSTLILVTSCEEYCKLLGYVSGVCGTPTSYCTGIDDVYQSGGDVYCPANYCCCGPVADVIAPSRVTNLSYTSSSMIGTYFPVNFTAPGDNGIYGTAKTYDVRYAMSTSIITNWTSALQMTDEPAPKAAGSAESFSVAAGQNYNSTIYVAMKTIDEAGNISPLSNIITVTTGADISKVICTDAYKNGYMPASWLNADYSYAEKHANDDIMRGYHAWGKPVVRIVQNNLKLAKRVYPMSAQWAKHTAYAEGIIKEDSAMGKMLIETAFPLCEKLGKLMREDGQLDYQFSDKDVEDVMEEHYQDYYNLDLSEEELVPLVKKDFETIIALAEKTYLEDRAIGFTHEKIVYEERWFVKFMRYFNDIYQRLSD